MAASVDSWQNLYETCQRLEHEVTSALSSSRGSSYHAQSEWREKVQESLGRFTLAALSLRQKIDHGSQNLTAGEKRRREVIVTGLEGREKQLRLVYQQQQGAKAKRMDEERQRKRLLDSNIIDIGNDDSWTNREDEPLLPGNAQGSSQDAVKSYHAEKDQILAEQDKGLDALHEVIIRQKRLAGNIQAEASAHNDLIDDIDQGLERTTQRLVDTTENVRIVGRGGKVWKLWLCIIVLLIGIIIIIAIPGRK